MTYNLDCRANSFVITECFGSTQLLSLGLIWYDLTEISEDIADHVDHVDHVPCLVQLFMASYQP